MSSTRTPDIELRGHIWKWANLSRLTFVRKIFLSRLTSSIWMQVDTPIWTGIQPLYHRVLVGDHFKLYILDPTRQDYCNLAIFSLLILQKGHLYTLFLSCHSLNSLISSDETLTTWCHELSRLLKQSEDLLMRLVT